MHTVDVFYIVCGDDRHYINLQKSLRSLNRISSVKKNVYVFDMSGKISSFEFDHDFVTINMPDVDKSGFYHHRIWKAKYQAAKILPNPNNYKMYIDTDCVIVNDNISDLCDKIGDSFGVTRHFWVPTFYNFISRVATNNKSIENELKKLGVVNNFPFVAGGIFLFKENTINKAIIDRTLELYASFYTKDQPYVNFVTDETFLSIAISELNNGQFLNGAFNHCAMNNMPLIIKGSAIYGKNPFDHDYEKVTVFHCDTSRRDPSLEYTGELKDAIKKAFYL